MKKRMYLVKREVIATSMAKAIVGRGKVYEITLADDKFQPKDPSPRVGFKSNAKKGSKISDNS